MPTIASKTRSSFGTERVQCGNELIAPERSEYRDERHVLHLWSCPKCDRSFEVIWSTDAKSINFPRLAADMYALENSTERRFTRNQLMIRSTALIAKLIITVIAAALLTETCYAQATGSGGRKQHQQKADKPATQTPKVDEKAYNAALKSLPDKPFDPWRGAR